ncbi:hypothetical protein ACM6Q7_12410 [Peribacillus butanolivorans]
MKLGIEREGRTQSMRALHLNEYLAELPGSIIKLLHIFIFYWARIPA